MSASHQSLELFVLFFSLSTLLILFTSPIAPTVYERPTASAQPAESFAPLRVAGAAGAAEAGVVGVGAEAGVDDQLAVGQFWLVHALWREVWTCSSRDKPPHSHC